MSESSANKSVQLFRIENPNIADTPDGLTSHEQLVGQWFTPDLDTAVGYLRKSHKGYGKEADPIPGAQLVVASVPADQLDTFHVSQDVIASKMDVENDNYLIPRDGTVETTIISLDDIAGSLQKGLGNVDGIREARERIRELFDQQNGT